MGNKLTNLKVEGIINCVNWIAFSANVQLIIMVMIEELLGENPKQGEYPAVF